MTIEATDQLGKLNAEATLRAALTEIRATLAKARKIRDEQNAIIRAHVHDEQMYARAVAVFDKASAKKAKP